jgi:hypothetical protein
MDQLPGDFLLHVATLIICNETDLNQKFTILLCPQKIPAGQAAGKEILCRRGRTGIRTFCGSGHTMGNQRRQRRQKNSIRNALFRKGFLGKPGGKKK